MTNNQLTQVLTLKEILIRRIAKAGENESLQVLLEAEKIELNKQLPVDHRF